MTERERRNLTDLEIGISAKSLRQSAIHSKPLCPGPMT